MNSNTPRNRTFKKRSGSYKYIVTGSSKCNEFHAGFGYGFFVFLKVVVCMQNKGKTDVPLLRLFTRGDLWREHLDGTVLSGGKRLSALVCWSRGFAAQGNETPCVLYPQKQKVLSSPSPFSPRCHILKKNKTEKEQIYSQGAWRSMNYLFPEILYYLCMKESPIIKSECFFFCMSIAGRSDWTGC